MDGALFAVVACSLRWSSFKSSWRHFETTCWRLVLTEPTVQLKTTLEVPAIGGRSADRCFSRLPFSPLSVSDVEPSYSAVTSYIVYLYIVMPPPNAEGLIQKFGFNGQIPTSFLSLPLSCLFLPLPPNLRPYDPFQK